MLLSMHHGYLYNGDAHIQPVGYRVFTYIKTVSIESLGLKCSSSQDKSENMKVFFLKSLG